MERILRNCRRLLCNWNSPWFSWRCSESIPAWCTLYPALLSQRDWKLEKKMKYVSPFANLCVLSILYTWGHIRGQWCWLSMPWLPAKLWGCPGEYGGSTSCPPRHSVWLWHGASFSICKVKYTTFHYPRLFNYSGFFNVFLQLTWTRSWRNLEFYREFLVIWL